MITLAPLVSGITESMSKLAAVQKFQIKLRIKTVLMQTFKIGAMQIITLAIVAIPLKMLFGEPLSITLLV